MSVVDGLWHSDHPTGDEEWYSNYYSVDALEHLSADQPFDFVIVGGGGSGVAAAIEASDSGASALVLEKMAAPGGSTQESGGNCRLVLDRDGAINHFWHLAQGATPREVIEAYVDGLVELPNWVQAHGGEFERPPEVSDFLGGIVFPSQLISSVPFPMFPSADSLGPIVRVRSSRPNREGGAALWDLLARSLADRDVPIVTNAPVTRLLQSGDRCVTGVEVSTPRGAITITARRAVLLCSGGFGYNQDMMLQYLGCALPAKSPWGRATGDGIRLAQDVGADLWHMSATAAAIGYKPEELKAGFTAVVWDFGFVLVDQLGRRYLCETSFDSHVAVSTMTVQDPETYALVRLPSYLIFDEQTRLAGKLALVGAGENRHYPWSADNSAEIDRGWITKANSVAALGQLLGLPAEQLERTIESFNGHCESNVTDRFERPASEMRTISAAPFYGVAVYPVLLNTQGGPRRNERGQVVRPNGSPIPGLYGAGELGSVWNRLYPHAGNIPETVISARLAVQSALM